MIEKQDSNHPHLEVERAIDELRRQSGIVLREDNGHRAACYPIEFLDETQLETLRSPALSLLITGARAKALGLGQQDMKIEAAALPLAAILALGDPLASKAPLPDMRFVIASEAESMALKLAKYASLLPALLLTENHPATGGWPEVAARHVHDYIEAPLVDVVQTAGAALPIEGADKSTIISFRSRHSTAVHLALLIGTPDAQGAPVTRIHSSCVTGDILGSLRCDCGDQLKLALAEITAAGSGILIYLHQEGRGIGITNKLRAYQLQEQGHDTYEANLMLGFEEDERDFGIAAAILRALGVTRIRLLTNNPQKIAALEKAGIEITERLPLVVETGRHNHAYLEAKGKKAGHLF